MIEKLFFLIDNIFFFWDESVATSCVWVFCILKQTKPLQTFLYAHTQSVTHLGETRQGLHSCTSGRQSSERKEGRNEKYNYKS